MYNNRRYYEIRLSICLLMSIVLLFFDRNSAFSTALKNYTSVLFVPSYFAVNYPKEIINDYSEYLNSQDFTIQQNRKLKIENLKLQAKLQKLQVLEQENKRLRVLLKSSAKVSDKLLVAELLYVVNEPGIQQFVLNQGSNKSVFVGQAVISATGIIGQVISVNPVTSRVLLITDIDHAIPVEVVRNNLRAIAVGMGDSNKLELINVSNTTDIIVGDSLFSSGLGERFPEGYPVGKVVSVDKNPALPFAKIIVEPYAKLTQTKEALLVWPGSKVTYNKDEIDNLEKLEKLEFDNQIEHSENKTNQNKVG